jgi:hypothetical protein
VARLRNGGHLFKKRVNIFPGKMPKYRAKMKPNEIRSNLPQYAANVSLDIKEA